MFIEFKKFVKSAVVATGCFASASAFAGLVTFGGTLTSISGNDLGINSGYLGADIYAATDVNLNYEFVGSEAGWKSVFFTWEGSFSNHGGTQADVSSSASEGEALEFAFVVKNTGKAVVNGGYNGELSNAQNSAEGGLPTFIVSDLGEDQYFLGLNDDGGSIDGDYDDLGVIMTVSAVSVPEPATIALLGVGLLGLGAARLKRD